MHLAGQVFTISPSRQFDVRFARALGLLLEAVQHVGGRGEFRNVHHSERARGIRDVDSPHASADGVDRLSVLWLVSTGGPIELKTGLPPRSLRKRLQILECAPAKLDGLALHHQNIQAVI